MNPATLAHSAYAQASAIAPSARETEYRAFADATHRLSAAATETGPARFPRLAEAVHMNRRLWSLLAEDVADRGNTLPEALRAQIFYLAEFTDQQSRRILSEGASTDVLVEINTAIMRGLRQDQPGPPQAAAAQTSGQQAEPRVAAR